MLLVEFVEGSRIERDPEPSPRKNPLPIVGNGPLGTFVRFAGGARVPLPTDQIVSVEEGGAAQVGFGGMRFSSEENGFLVFHRFRDLRPERELSPERGRRMTLAVDLVSAVFDDGRLVWPVAS